MPLSRVSELTVPSPDRGKALAVSRREIGLLIALLAGTTILSQFFRASLAVIAPELIRDLALSPEMLGLANGGFFGALLVAQIGVGVAFDRIGPRRTVGALSILMRTPVECGGQFGRQFLPSKYGMNVGRKRHRRPFSL